MDFGDQAINMLCVCQETLLAATGDGISVLSFEEKGKEARTSKLGAHRSKHLLSDEVSALSVAAAPARNLIFGGYSDGSVAVWTTAQFEAFVVIKAHSNEVTQLAWIELP